MNISNIAPSTIEKIQWTARILSLAVVISIILIGFFQYRMQISDLPSSVSLWSTVWVMLTIPICFLIAVVIAWRWSFTGGAFLVAISGLFLVLELVTIIMHNIEGDISRSSYAIATDSLLLMLFICGLIYLLIGSWKRKSSASPI